MGKKERGNKETKKQPLLTQKEKKAAKKAKTKDTGNIMGSL